jgi:hypothetical protein
MENTQTHTYRQLIYEGINGLAPEALVEIVDFVYFVRKRTLQPQAFEEHLRTALLNKELRDLSSEEEHHMDKEFEDYDKLYPHEENLEDIALVRAIKTGEATESMTRAEVFRIRKGKA